MVQFLQRLTQILTLIPPETLDRPPPLPCTLPEAATPQDTGIMRPPPNPIRPVYRSINPLPVMSISLIQITPSALIPS